MPTAKQLAKFQKALADAALIFDDVDLSTVALPVESATDILREAASVIAYFDHKEKFIEEICRSCGNKFIYAYYCTAVKCCSISCMAAHLESLGLRWDPSAPLERRWGPRGTPAIVPASVYTIIQEQAPEPEAPEPVVISDESKKLIDDLAKLLD